MDGSAYMEITLMLIAISINSSSELLISTSDCKASKIASSSYKNIAIQHPPVGGVA